MKGRALILVTDNAALATGFAEVAVMREGRVVEHGTVERLARPGGALAELGVTAPVAP
jgi:ABC-type dipeptide/oligopeptide/nickel transport system ATPase component